MDPTRTTPLSPGSNTPPAEAISSLRITVVSGPGAGRSELVAQPRVLVGRASTADVRLDDPAVSQFHVELVASPAGIRVTDLGSRNGTRIAGVVFERAVMPPGTLVEVGSSVLRVDLGGDVAQPRADVRAFGGMVGESPAMRALYALLERLARTDLSVVITGETGTGKEVTARAMHRESPRARGPFQVLDCTALPPSLAGSILFGHEKGAFTGANERRAGVFEAANGGTLFIDEVGELSSELQPMLLRVLQQREVTPLGSNKPRAVDVRIVSATWRDLRAMVNAGTFREDLYYRLAQATVRMPSLAERREDIGLLVHYFLERGRAQGRPARGIARDALEALIARHYPGNVRELQSTVERLAVLSEGPMISAADLTFERMMAAVRDRALDDPAAGVTTPPPAIAATATPTSAPPAARGTAPPAAPEPGEATSAASIEPFKDAKRTLIDEFEKAYLSRLLARCKNNLSQAAIVAGLERHNLRVLLRKHGLYEPKE